MTPADRCRSEIAAIEALPWGEMSEAEALGACIGWLDWWAELREVEKYGNA